MKWIHYSPESHLVFLSTIFFLNPRFPHLRFICFRSRLKSSTFYGNVYTLRFVLQFQDKNQITIVLDKYHIYKTGNFIFYQKQSLKRNLMCIKDTTTYISTILHFCNFQFICFFWFSLTTFGGDGYTLHMQYSDAHTSSILQQNKLNKTKK